MNRPFVIGVIGGSGSGKTTLLNDLRRDFDESQICVITQDEYYKPITEQQQDAWGVENFDIPEAIDLAAFERDLYLILDGETVQRPKYSFNNEHATQETLTFKPAKVVVVEGIFVFHTPAILKRCDLKIYMHTPDHLKIIRRVKRDKTERNYPLEDVLHRYEHHVQPAFKVYIEPYREMADLVFNNVENFKSAYGVLRTFITQVVKG